MRPAPHGSPEVLSVVTLTTVASLAHAMASVQEAVQDEVVWDRRALEAVDVITEVHAAKAGVTSGLYPSLHLDLSECYRKLGDLKAARAHLERGRAAVGSLGNDGYAQMIKVGLDRLSGRLAPA